MSQLNLKFYSGCDQYSDGDVEDDILRYVKESEPEQYKDILARDQRFPVFYHLSSYRQHLLDWYKLDHNASLLEIGGGMGAFTHMFCEKCANVTTVELSKRRAEAIRWRCRDQDNLEIYVGDIMSAEFQKQYDYITVLGVLEYQSMYSDSQNPQIDFLSKLRSFLKPDGKLFVAIENKMGLKYWCGDVEDHCGIPFTSINDYAYGGKARTFDKHELEEILHESGFPFLKFYYPLPDYKFPRVLYTDQYLPKKDVLSCVIPNYYAGMFHSQYSVVANERTLYPSIARNRVFPFFANSFLVECSQSAFEDNGVDFVSTTAERSEPYLIQTVISGKKVRKQPTHKKGEQHLEQTYRNIQILHNRGLDVIPHVYDNGAITLPFINQPTVEEVLIDRIRKKDIHGAQKLIDSVYEAIKRASDECDETECIIYDLGLDQRDTESHYELVQKQAFCDMIFSNCFLCDGSLKFYDQEWVFERVPASFVLYRALKILYSANEYLDMLCPFHYWLDLYHITTLNEVYDRLEEALFCKIQDDVTCGIIGQLRKLPTNTVQDNIALLTRGKYDLDIVKQQLSSYMEAYKQRDCDVATLEAALEQRGTDVSTLEAALEQRSTDVSTLEAALKQRSTDVSTLEAALEQRSTDVSTLEAALAQRSAEMRAVEKTLEQKVREVCELEQSESSLREIVKVKDNQLQEQRDAITRLQKRLSEIEETWIYRLSIKILRVYKKFKKPRTRPKGI